MFHFLAFLQYWLVFPAVTGVALTGYMTSLYFRIPLNSDESAKETSFLISRSVLASAYGIAFMIYLSLTVENWKRHSNDLCFKWGTLNSNYASKTRPQFTSSTKVYDRYSGQYVYVVSLPRRVGRVLTSVIVLLPIVACTILCHLGVMMWVYSDGNRNPIPFKEIFTVNLCQNTKVGESFACSLGNSETIRTNLISSCCIWGLIITAQSRWRPQFECAATLRTAAMCFQLLQCNFRCSLTKKVAVWLTDRENYQTHDQADRCDM